MIDTNNLHFKEHGYSEREPSFEPGTKQIASAAFTWK